MNSLTFSFSSRLNNERINDQIVLFIGNIRSSDGHKSQHAMETIVKVMMVHKGDDRKYQTYNEKIII